MDFVKGFMHVSIKVCSSCAEDILNGTVTFFVSLCSNAVDIVQKRPVC